MTPSTLSTDRWRKSEPKQVRFSVVFNNVPYRTELKTSWGFSCVIEGLDKTVLFDTGGNGEILLSNMRQLGVDAEAVDVVVLSHIHSDHTGGLAAFLKRNHEVAVYLPTSFPASLQGDVKGLEATVVPVSGPQELFVGAYSTGEMGMAIKEQALIVDTRRGSIVVAGCSHPNIADMAERARAYLGKNIYLLMGGFHLGGSSQREIQAIIGRLKALGVEKVAPSHCTGESAMRMFREAWASDFVEGGLGAIIEVPDA